MGTRLGSSSLLLNTVELKVVVNCITFLKWQERWSSAASIRKIWNLNMVEWPIAPKQVLVHLVYIHPRLFLVAWVWDKSLTYKASCRSASRSIREASTGEKLNKECLFQLESQIFVSGEKRDKDEMISRINSGVFFKICQTRFRTTLDFF